MNQIINNNTCYTCNSNLYGTDCVSGFEYKAHVGDDVVVSKIEGDQTFYFCSEITSPNGDPILLKTDSVIFAESVEIIKNNKYHN